MLKHKICFGHLNHNFLICILFVGGQCIYLQAVYFGAGSVFHIGSVFWGSVFHIGSVLWGSVVSSDIWTLARRRGGSQGGREGGRREPGCLPQGRPLIIFISIKISKIFNFKTDIFIKTSIFISIKISFKTNILSKPVSRYCIVPELCVCINHIVWKTLNIKKTKLQTELRANTKYQLFVFVYVYWCLYLYICVCEFVCCSCLRV